MPCCCCPHSNSASRIFGLFARRYRRRFERRGFEASQKQLLSALGAAGFQNSTILEIGCGVGHFNQTMLEQGAASATGIDLAPPMIEEARRWAEERGLSEQSTYIAGDFLEIDHPDRAEVTVLDKVICCYPHADKLVPISASHTTRVYGFTVPKNRWYTRAGAIVGAGLMKILGSDFRPYVHNPDQIDKWLGDLGFELHNQASTFIWLSRVYTKK